MRVQEVVEVIEELRNQGNSDDQIAMSFYLMYVDDKIDKNQFKALLGVLDYSLPKFFWELESDEQIKFFMEEYK